MQRQVKIGPPVEGSLALLQGGQPHLDPVDGDASQPFGPQGRGMGHERPALKQECLPAVYGRSRIQTEPPAPHAPCFPGHARSDAEGPDPAAGP